MTLRSDIPLPEYHSLLTTPSSTANATIAAGSLTLPPSITHLTLELFTLGFPSPLLTSLSTALPNLASLTLWSTLLDGVTDTSRSDAENFITTLSSSTASGGTAGKLQEAHFIDTFVRPGFWTHVGKTWGSASTSTSTTAPTTASSSKDAEGGMKALEVSYTYRGHTESDFLARIHGHELPSLIVPGLVGASFGFVEEAEGEAVLEAERVQEGEGGVVGGVLPFARDGRATRALVGRFEVMGRERQEGKGGLGGLRVLGLGMWTLGVGDVASVLWALEPSEEDGEGALVDLTVAVEMEGKEWVKKLGTVMNRSGSCWALEGLEVVGVPVGGGKGGNKQEVMKEIAGQAEEVGKEAAEGVKLMVVEEVKFLGEVCPRLKRMEMSVLKARKAGVVVFTRDEGGEWKKE